MPQQIKEEDGVHNEWYERAKTIKLCDLSPFIKKLTEDYTHDYGTIVHSIAASAIAAAHAVNESEQGGITGFQAGAVMWEFIKNWMGYKDKPLRLVDYSNMLYPQYEHNFNKTIRKETFEFLQKEAAKNLSDIENAHEDVIAHWRSIVDGKVPFGYGIE